MAEGDRKIITLPYGEGLARSEGVMVVAPNSFDDIREFYFYKGRAQVRKGLTESTILIDDVGADILGPVVALAPLRAENAAMGVAHDPASEEIWVNRLAIDGTTPSNVGLFGLLPATATFDPPIIIMADTDGKQFIAHDEPFFNARIVTQYYDSLTFPFLNNLTADLDGNGDADVFFRGVARHLSYIFGWGFGSDSQKDRPSIVRVSTAGNVTQFLDDAFFDVGQPGEPVMVCRSAGAFFMVFKETETHQIFGYSPDTFGVRPSDTLYGCVSSRLAVSVAGTVFFWSVQGPRATNGGESVDLAVPLDLDGPDPATLAAESDVQNAFAEYDPATRVVNFVWGDRIYALSLRDPANPKWSYYEPGRTIQCGAQFYDTQATGGAGAPPADGPEFNAPAVPTIGSDTMIIDWNNIGATGGEIVEIWTRINPAGPWGILKQVETDLSASQQTTIGDPPPRLVPLTTYDIAIRYRRGGQFNPSSTDPDPTTWPAAAQTTETTSVSQPQLIVRGKNNGLWEVPSAGNEQIKIEWVNPPGHELLEIEIERRIRSEGNAGTQDVDGNGIGPPDTPDQTLVAFTPIAGSPFPAGTTELIDTAIVNFRWNDYRLRYVGGGFSVTIECWAGPDAPADNSFSANGDGESNFITLAWSNAIAPIGRTSCPGPSNPPSGHQTLAYQNNVTLNPGSDGWNFGIEDVAAAFATFGSITVQPTPVGNDEDIRVGLRHLVTCFGTVYPSYWSVVTASPDFRSTLAGSQE